MSQFQLLQVSAAIVPHSSEVSVGVVAFSLTPGVALTSQSYKYIKLIPPKLRLLSVFITAQTYTPSYNHDAI